MRVGRTREARTDRDADDFAVRSSDVRYKRFCVVGGSGILRARLQWQ
jgi:hypothetical protein